MRKAPMADVNRVGNDGVVAGLSRRRVAPGRVIALASAIARCGRRRYRRVLTE